MLEDTEGTIKNWQSRETGRRVWRYQRSKSKWKHRVHKTKTNKTKTQHNMC